jgi:hypothetical protein
MIVVVGSAEVHHQIEPWHHLELVSYSRVVKQWRHFVLAPAETGASATAHAAVPAVAGYDQPRQWRGENVAQTWRENVARTRLDGKIR